jgi:uncharacterized protein (DUF433 family)
MRLVPGIVFVDGPAGRRARIAGTELDVWDVISAYRSVGNDRTQFYAAFDSLTPGQFNAAYDYFRAFPEEFDELLGRESRHTRAGSESGPPRTQIRASPSGGQIAPL